MILTALLALFAVLILLWYRSRCQHFKFFKRLGLPGPEPNTWTGNLDIIKKQNIGDAQSDWIATYGSICGFYMGSMPVVLVADPELIKLILVKEAKKFLEREFFIRNGSYTDHRIVDLLSFQTGAKWKATRTILAPCFRTAKLKKLLALILEETDTFLELLRKAAEKDGGVDVTPMIERWALAVIIRATMGLENRVQTDPDDQLYHSMHHGLGLRFLEPAFVLSLSFPYIESTLVNFYKCVDWIRHFFGFLSLRLFVDASMKALFYRKNNPKIKPDDFFQDMLDAGTGIKESDKQIDGNGKKMSTMEILANAMNLILAGHDTMGIVTSNMFYFLALHQDIQDKMRHEIITVLESRKPDYESLQRLKYVGQVMNETLRMQPVTRTFMSRKSAEPFTFSNIKFPKGTVFQIPTYSLHRSPQFWDNPDSFDPERFSEESKGGVDSAVFQPFGLGPRQCIGLRMATLQVKALFSQLLRTFRILPYSHQSKGKPEMLDHVFVTKIKGGVSVKLQVLRSTP